MPYSSIVFLVLTCVDLQNQTFWGLIFQVLAPRVIMPNVGHNPLHLKEMFHIFVISLSCVVTVSGMGFQMRLCLYLSYPSFASLLSFAVEALLI